MKAVVYDGTLWLNEDVAMPQVAEDEALLKVRLAGICNTDLELIDGMYDFSGILGHEFVAEVVSGPEGLAGKRVVGEINVTCGVCDFCQRGIPSQCRNRHAVGIHDYPGAFAEYMRLPVRNLYPVPDGVADAAAVFTEPLAAALAVTEAVHVSPRDKVIVLGAGKLGMLTAQVLKLTGADIQVVVRHQKQADLLSRWRIPSVDIDDLPDERAQVVVDCTGQASGFTDALRLVEARGKLVLKSTFHGLPAVDLTQIAVREVQVVGSRCGPFDAALRLLDRQLVDVEGLIEASYPLSDAMQALEHAQRKGTLKVLLDIQA